MSVAVLENIPPMLMAASAITTAFIELVTIAGTARGKHQRPES